MNHLSLRLVGEVGAGNSEELTLTAVVHCNPDLNKYSHDCTGFDPNY